MAPGNRRLLAFAALVLALAGCSSFRKEDPPLEPNVMPANYRQNLLTFLQQQLTDPVGVREAFVSEPRLQPIGTESRYVACLRYNSKDGFGQYVGVKEYAAIYFNGSLTQYVPATPELCGRAAYVPFPELERLKRLGS